MTDSSPDQLHEAPDTLGAEVVDRHRAIRSLMEELEAVDWYEQRARACTDDELRTILIHNRDEEKEHATMLLEWLRRSDPKLAGELRARIGRSGAIARELPEAEASEEPPLQQPSAGDGSLGIGSLRLSPPGE